MASAKIILKDGFTCAPNGHTVVVYPFGSVVDGKVAEWAIKSQAAKKLTPKIHNKKLNPKIENKARNNG